MYVVAEGTSMVVMVVLQLYSVVGSQKIKIYIYILVDVQMYINSAEERRKV